MNKFDLKARKIAIAAIFGMIGIWIVLSIFSFTGNEARKRPDTQKITFNGQSALKGKQVFQAYNCMDCHTIVGNGAYFAPDLTHIYNLAGPAWLRAYLGSPGTYPAEAIVNIQYQQLKDKGVVDNSSFEDYLKEFEGAKDRVEHRGGVEALMPNLRFSSEEIDQLIAYLKYTAALNTGGWPPKVIARKSVIEKVSRELEEESGLHPETDAPADSKSVSGQNSISSGEQDGRIVATNLGCMACHSTDGSVKIGPSFKGLYGSEVKLSDGKVIKADDAYLEESILKPDAQIVNGFPGGVMPHFDGIVSQEQVSELISFIKSQK